jgi:hypothetical protein
MSTSLSHMLQTLSLLSVTTSSLGLAIGALSPTGDIALAIGPGLMVIYILIGAIGPAGRTESKTGNKSPFYIDIIRKASPIRWACEALCVDEFSDKVYINGKPNIVLEKVGKYMSRFIRFVLYQPIMQKLQVSAQSNLNKLFPKRKQVDNNRKLILKNKDKTLEKLGIANAKYEQSISILWKLLLSHLGITLVGLLISKSKE